MGKVKFFIDFDDTLVQSSKRFCELYSKIYKNDTEFIKPNYRVNDLWNFGEQCPLLNKRNKHTVEDLFGMKEFFNGLKLQPNAYDVIKELNEKYDLCIVSIGTMSNLQYKAEYIKNNLSFINNAILLYNKGSHMNKSVVNCPEDSIFMDDVLSNLYSVKSKNKYIYGVEKPWNINGMSCKRLLSYDEVANEFLK
jgi:5'(3')-deoxyribonucleotidase